MGFNSGFKGLIIWRFQDHLCSSTPTKFFFLASWCTWRICEVTRFVLQDWHCVAHS